jgi:glucose/arabinose dehydrogenase
VWGSGDLLWRINRLGVWYGWPDFHGSTQLSHWKDHYKPPGKDAPKDLLAEHPNRPPDPAAVLGVHASACGLDFSKSQAWGTVAAPLAYIAQFGDMAPKVGKVLAPVGYNIVRVDPRDGTIETFATNRAHGDAAHQKINGPASLLKTGGLERPIAARFDRTGASLYVVDFGILTMTKNGPQPKPGTGVLWRITKEAQP